MIYVLELPDQRPPRAWFAFDGADLLRKVAAATGVPAWSIWDRQTPRGLLTLFDERTDSPGVAQRLPVIVELGIASGWDTPVFRADHLPGRQGYSDRPVSLAQACEARLRVQGDCRVWWTEEQAVLALESDNDPLWTAAGWRAQAALREQLVATEALCDD